MLLVTLEGLPHSGRAAVVRALAKRRPEWAVVAVPTDPPGASACAWSSPGTRHAHAMYNAALHKMRALQPYAAAASRAQAKGQVVMLTAPWFEYLPEHPTNARLLRASIVELAGALGVTAEAHVLVHLHVPHDETFEQIVCSGNSFFNATSLGDVRAEQVRISQQLHDAPGAHPFPCAAFAIRCPPFFDDNELMLGSVAEEVARLVDLVRAA